jgi:ABC-type transport system involved in cytochrome c biogenesis permease subunit
MHKTAHPLQWVIVGLFGGYVLLNLVRAGVGDPANSYQFREFGALPIVEGGRIKPFDTLARSRLLIINRKQTFKDEDDKTCPATQWLLDTMLTQLPKGGAGMRHKVFRIENDQVLGLLGLEQRPGKWRYALNEFQAHIKDLDREAKLASKKEEKDRSLFEAKVLELAHHVDLYVRIASMETPGIIPTKGDWLSLGQALDDARAGRDPHPLTVALFHALMSYAGHDVEGFNDAVKDYRAAFEKGMPEVLSTTGLEVYFNELEPFYHCAVLYAFIFVLACVSWLGWFQPLNRGAFWSMVLIALLHSWALLIRIYIQGRPPVTNLYSSAIFIGWGGVLTCLFMEYFFRNSIALAVGAVTGGLTLLIAHFLSLEGDTMEMMQAVLDTNFWLATHVTCVTLGYTATFVSGFLGVAYVSAMAVSAIMGRGALYHQGVRGFLERPDSRLGARGFFTRFFDTDASSVIGNMIYGVVCFGMFLSFTGTVLGGLWADYSWGRFWGWDPKENGALLIVIWCALILHARWGGMVKQRGMAVLAVLGMIVTSWSWFGTNFLGVGLHSYGFMEGAMWWLGAFDVTVLVIAGIGLLPLGRWAKLPPRAPLPAAGAAAPKPAKVPQTV